MSTASSWRTVPLKDLVAGIQAGTSVIGEDRARRAGDRAVLKVSAVSRNGFRPDECKVVWGSELARLSTHVRAGTIAFSRSNTPELVGLSAYIEHSDPDLYHSDKLWQINANEECILPRFLGYLLRLPELRLEFTKRASGSSGSMYNISQGSFLTCECTVPCRCEQGAILEVLECAEEAVRAADALIERKVAYRKALAETLLTGRSRFPGFDDVWDELQFSEFFESKDARAPNAQPAILSCSKLYGILLQSDRFSKQLASADHRHYKHIVPGDLVYDPMLLWDASISFTELEGVVSPAYETLSWIGDEKGDRRYFKALFRSEMMKQTYKRISQGTNARRRKAPVTDFLRVSLPLPGKDEQRRIADLLGEVDTEIALLRKQREALNGQKQGLMQKLLTGEVRLKEFRC